MRSVHSSVATPIDSIRPRPLCQRTVHSANDTHPAAIANPDPQRIIRAAVSPAHVQVVSECTFSSTTQLELSTVPPPAPPSLPHLLHSIQQVQLLRVHRFLRQLLLEPKSVVFHIGVESLLSVFGPNPMARPHHSVHWYVPIPEPGNAILSYFSLSSTSRSGGCLW